MRGWVEDQAKYVARHAEHLKVVRRADVGNLKGLTLESYHRLVSFLVERDKEQQRTLTTARIPYEGSCHCSPKEVYGKIKRDLDIPYLPTGEIYLKALEYSSKTCDEIYGGCALEALEIKEFIELMVKERDMVCDKLMW